MASSNQTPDVLFSPIAANADASDINTIPQTYDPANYGYAAQNVGFPTECRLPVLNPDGTLGQGRAPRMQDWNGIMKLVSSHNFFLQNGGSYTFNPTVSSNIGGYPKNAVLWYFPENEDPCLVYSLINDNTNNFVDDPTLIDEEHWKKLSFGDRISTPFFFGQSMYSENAPYNASWLASNGQYNAASVYPDFWTQLTGVELNGSLNVGDTIEISGKTYVKRGLPVVLSSGTITDYDFVVNQNDQTFRLPLLNGEEDLPSDRYDSLTYVSGQTYTAPANGWFSTGGPGSFYSLNFDNNTGAARTLMIPTGTTGFARGFGFVKKGGTFYLDPAGGVTPESIRFIYAKGNGTLYYYVGDTVQDASLINAGAVLGQLANKADIDASNFNADGKSLLSGLSNPSTQRINLVATGVINTTVTTTEQTYIAPANGVVQIVGLDSNYVLLTSNNLTNRCGSGAGSVVYARVEVSKGETVHIKTDTGTASLIGAIFVYANGEV